MERDDVRRVVRQYLRNEGRTAARVLLDLLLDELGPWTVSEQIREWREDRNVEENWR